MESKKFSPEEPDWDKFLEQLNSDSQLEGQFSPVESTQFNELKRLVAETADALSVYDKLDCEGSWNTCMDKARERNLVEEVASNRFWSVKLFMRYAAAVIFLTLTIGGYFLIKTKFGQVVEDSVIAGGIEPGGSKARLTLSNGDTMVLDADEKGIRIDDKGISYESGGAVSSFSQEVTYATLSVPRAGQYQLVLPDGSKVWLNSESELTYPVSFKGTLRVVHLKGEGFFDVQHMVDRPFVVKSKGQDIEVLGTAFNVSAYENDGAVTTTLVRGRVQIGATGVDERFLLKPGMQALVRNGHVHVKTGVNVEEYTAWKDGVIVLEKQNIREVLKQIERWYDVEFVVGKTDLPMETMSGEVSNKLPIDVLLKGIEGQLNIKFEQNGRRFMIKN
ncbi:FecR family protein [Sphingobacterium tabacisoli]|uniref:FecR family protein n=1 Tax=Sphingobacterium tabacisoli TaxID=2044855 RepID=A0ABW5L246_9SPHI|nr:FecR family protein [Sphingobacterium tabacisoli]